MKKPFSLLTGLLLLVMNTSHAVAQEAISAPACAQDIESRLTQQGRLLEQVWYGYVSTADAPLNSVRHDEDGNTWMKVAENSWRAAENIGVRSLTDTELSEKLEWPEMNTDRSSDRRSRIGIFAQKQMLTSELIPDLIQSMDAFGHRLDMVCAAVSASIAQTKPKVDGFLHIEIPGAVEMLSKPLKNCTNLRDDIPALAENTVLNSCQPLAKQMFERETAFLRIAVAYDAAQRSLLQTGGAVDFFVRGLRGDVLAPLQQTMTLLSQFSRIPCFAAQCNE